MRKVQWVALWFLSAAVACGQSAKDAVDALRASMGKGQFVLRNFSGEDRVRANWTGGTLEFVQPGWRTFGVLVMDSAKLKGKTLTISCIRHVAVRDKDDKVVLYAVADPVEIDIDFGGADPAAVLPRLTEALFYSTIGEALAAVPPDLQSAIPARMALGAVHPSESSSVVKSVCDCANKEKSDCDYKELRSDGMVPPKYIRGDDPEFSERARKSKVNGYVDVRLKVDERGHPEDVWVAYPLGTGLDEAAARSVLSYQFRPATCHGTPVSVYLAVRVNFQIH